MILALLGSGEFLPWHAGVDRWLLERARPGGVLVLPTASAPEGDEVFARWGSMGTTHYRDELGVDAEVVPLRTRADAERPELVARLDDAALVFFSGGNPAYLVHVLRDTPFWTALRSGMDDGLAYGGCSAGAACLGRVVPDSAASRRDGSLVWGPGLGVLQRCCLAPHWDALETFRPGLTEEFVSSVPAGDRLLAVDERTAVFGDGRDWLVAGAGAVHVRDESDGWRHAFAEEA
ncbi:MAG: Type 1 glutamine amidotransferase-like domain-containing protein, partial [Actinomycetota bacterium]